VASVVDVVEPIESKRRPRTTLVAVTAGVVVAAGLAAYGFSRSDDDGDPATPPTIGVIQAPAEVFTTQPLVVIPALAPTTDDLPIVPFGTVDIGAPLDSTNILVP
jgi:hypothetical protein